ncbi:MAG: choice-of-anchor tandem repeat GloVer-containing protein [Terracidiphilus sp.]
MQRRRRSQIAIESTSWSSAIYGMALTLLFVIVVCEFITLAAEPVQAQAYTVIHSFTDQDDGALPYAGVTLDTAGNLYGTTLEGAAGFGEVFKMSFVNSKWVFTTLHLFGNQHDGEYPFAGVIRDANGAIYGTDSMGGRYNWGTVFQLRPPPTIPSPWNENIIHSFTGGSDGSIPTSQLVFDESGNLYGTTTGGGTGFGDVFELTPSNGGWTETVLYTFTGRGDGDNPWSNVVLDSASNIYGTTVNGGALVCGTVFQLTPSGSSWVETVLHNFTGFGDGCHPYAGVILDHAGNLYGTTVDTTLSGGVGTVFELSAGNGQWSYRSLYSFTTVPSGFGSQCTDGGAGTGPTGNLIMDSAGNLYGTTSGDGAFGWGNVFKLTPSNGEWIYTSLYDFTGGSDGGAPCGAAALDARGNLYGSTILGGTNFGVVWEITP